MDTFEQDEPSNQIYVLVSKSINHTFNGFNFKPK